MAYAGACVPTLATCRIWFTTRPESAAALCGQKTGEDAGYVARLAYRCNCRWLC